MSNVKKVYAGEHQTLFLTNSNELYYIGWRNHVSLVTGGEMANPTSSWTCQKANMMDEHAVILTNDNKKPTAGD